MKKFTKRELLRRIEALEEFATYADNLLTQLNHALPDTPELKLKQLDQSAFDHEFVTDIYNYLAINANGQSIFFSDKPKVNLELGIWYSTAGSTMPMLKGYDTSDWQNSLIERKELTGSDLTRAMLERGDKVVLCKAYDHEENDFYYDAITSCSDVFFDSCLTSWSYAIPVNNQGETLTASEVGL